MQLPPNSIIASGPVIIEEINGKLCTLLNKAKTTDKRPNPKWQFCGGEAEDFDVNLEETAKREVKEEMGIDIEIEKLLDVILIKRNDNSIVIAVHYLAKRIGEIKPGPEISEWNWFPLDELPEDCAPNIKPVIEKIQKS
ncbi:NUDIX hydrolase [Patescibacteria group bacterium]|nr:NUDIX hydrolase [Patescibacteria group bacterium]